MTVVPFLKSLSVCPHCGFNFGGEVEPSPNVECGKCEGWLWPQLWRLWRNPDGEVSDSQVLDREQLERRGM